MKLFVIIGFFLCGPLCLSSQSLFFDQLVNSTWISDQSLSDSTGVHRKIGLCKAAAAGTEPETGTITWHFAKQLTISHYRPRGEKKVLATHTYKIDEEKGVLCIQTQNGTLCYKAGIVSTGNYAFLTLKKNKHKKTAYHQTPLRN